MKRDYSVSMIRISAMFFIVLCHLCSHLGQIALAQFFNVGVQIFFLISGYLYGNKEIKRPGYWLYKRFIRLEIPALIWLGMAVISALLRRSNLPALHECVFLLLNLEGLNFIFSSIQDLFIGPWFFTNIMCCYLLLLCFLSIEKKHPGIAHVFDYGGIIPLFLFGLLGMCGISTDGALAFFLGFHLKREGLLENHRKYNIVISVGCFTIAVALRLIAKQYIDASVFYDEVIAPGTHVMIAAAFVVGMKWLFGVAPNVMNAIASSKAMHHLDMISIYVYICHERSFAVLSWPVPMIVSVLLMLLFIVSLSTFLWYIGEFLTKQIDRAVNYLFI